MVIIWLVAESWKIKEKLFLKKIEEHLLKMKGVIAKILGYSSLGYLLSTYVLWKAASSTLELAADSSKVLSSREIFFS